jgi:hypothetical protein
VLDFGILVILDGMLDSLPLGNSGVQTGGQVRVVPFLESQDEVASVLDEVPDVGRVGAKAVLGRDDFQVRVVFPELLEPSSASVALTVVFVVTIMIEDGLGRQGDDLLALRVDDDSPIGLQAVGGLAGRAGLSETSGRGELLGDEVGGPVARDEKATFQVDHVFQELASLGSAEDFIEGRAQSVGLYWIESGAHPGVTGRLLDAVDRSEIVLLDDPSPIEGQQRRIFQGKHGETRHENIGKRNIRIAIAGVGDILEAFANTRKQRIGIQMLAHQDSELPGLLSLALSLELSWSHGQLSYISPLGLSRTK